MGGGHGPYLSKLVGSCFPGGSRWRGGSSHPSLHAARVHRTQLWATQAVTFTLVGRSMNSFGR